MLTYGGRSSFTVSTKEKGRKKERKKERNMSPPAQGVGRDAILEAAMFDVQLTKWHWVRLFCKCYIVQSQ